MRHRVAAPLFPIVCNPFMPLAAGKPPLGDARDRHRRSRHASLASQPLLLPYEACEAKTPFSVLLRHPSLPRKTRFHCELARFSAALASSASSSWSSQPGTLTTTTYAWFDGAVQDLISYDYDTGSGSNPVYTTDLQLNALCQLTGAAVNDGIPKTVAYTLDEAGQIIRHAFFPHL